MVASSLIIFFSNCLPSFFSFPTQAICHHNQTWLHPLPLNLNCLAPSLHYLLTQPHPPFAIYHALVVLPTSMLGTRVPNFGAPFGMVMVEGCWEPGLEEGDDSMLPLDWGGVTVHFLAIV